MAGFLRELFFGPAPEPVPLTALLMGDNRPIDNQTLGQYEAEFRERLDSLKEISLSGDVDLEEKETRQFLYDLMFAVQLPELKKFLVEMGQQDSIVDGLTKGELIEKMFDPSFEKFKKHYCSGLDRLSLVTAAAVIGSARLRGDLYVHSALIAALPSTEWDDTVTLRSDRITFGWNAGKLSADTKVSLSIDGAKQFVSVGSRTTSSSNSSSTYQNQFLRLGPDVATHSSGASQTANIVQLMDSTSATLVITDPKWQFMLVFGSDRVNGARAFAERVEMQVNSLTPKTPDSIEAKATKPAIELKEDLVAKIKELKELLNEGILTQEEFSQAKKKLLK